MDYVAIFIFVTYPRSRLNVLVSIYYIQYIHYYNIALLVYTIYKRINHLKNLIQI